MNETSVKVGRPKLLDRDHVICVATACYWEHGPTDVPISEICEKAGVSKPALYREFCNDDGLRVAVLDSYRKTALAGLFERLGQDKPFMDVIEDVLAYILPPDKAAEDPDGCLVIAMRGRKGRLGERTLETLAVLQCEQIESYRRLIKTCQANGSVRPDLSPEDAAGFCNMIFTGAMQLHREGIPNQEVADGLRLGLRTLAVAQ